jgi:hypothetical protein
MRMRILASASIAAALAVTMVDATPADAAERRLTVRKVQKLSVAKPAKQSHVLRHMKRVQKVDKKPLALKKDAPKLKVMTKKDTPKLVVTKPLLKKGNSPLLVQGSGSHLKLGKAGKLPVFKPVAATTALKARVGVPMQNFKPKMTLMKGPKPQFAHKLSPFVQRHWKKAFFWVAVAGIGYLTIPELYYDRFVTYVEEDDYDGCIRLLSYAAVEDEDEVVRVRKPMPQNASYRYTARTAPEPANLSAAADQACKFDPFVERNWGRPYVWVQIPKVGNVTVPEDYYDQFVGYVSAEPSDFSSACNVLSEAAAMDTVAMTSPTAFGQDTQ